jgi:hypothetical protein
VAELAQSVDRGAISSTLAALQPAGEGGAVPAGLGGAVAALRRREAELLSVTRAFMRQLLATGPAELDTVTVGLGRIVTLHQRSSNLYWNRYHSRFLYF